MKNLKIAQVRFIAFYENYINYIKENKKDLALSNLRYTIIYFLDSCKNKIKSQKEIKRNLYNYNLEELQKITNSNNFAIYYYYDKLKNN